MILGKKYFFILLLCISANATYGKTITKDYKVSLIKSVTCVFETNQVKKIYQMGLTKKNKFFYYEPFDFDKKFVNFFKEEFIASKMKNNWYKLLITDRKKNKYQIIVNFERRVAYIINNNKKILSKRCY